MLSGVVEFDETFVGGRTTGKQGGSTDKVPVMVAVERIGTHRPIAVVGPGRSGS
jgi:hypothetical protein